MANMLIIKNSKLVKFCGLQIINLSIRMFLTRQMLSSVLAACVFIKRRFKNGTFLVFPAKKYYSRLSITRIHIRELKSFRVMEIRIIESNYRGSLTEGTEKSVRVIKVRVIEVRVIESLLY